MRVMGRIVDQPRLIAYMANDPANKYTYSGLTLDPKSWSPAVAEIKVSLEKRNQKRAVARSGMMWLMSKGRTYILFLRGRSAR